MNLKSSAKGQGLKRAPPLKRPAACGGAKTKTPPLKRPAASGEVQSQGTKKVPKNPLTKYCKMMYTTGKAALRNNFSHGRQLFQFGTGQSKDELYRILDLCIKQLENGMPEAEAERFCKGKLTPVEDVS